MPRKFYRIAAVLAASLLLSSCANFNPVTEKLMRPPRLTPEQTALEEALKASVISNPISFKYPKTGDHRSAFVFHDIDGDKQDEALVFYATADSDYARIAVLDNKDGVWEAKQDLAGANRDVEFISFANITDAPTDDIVIGWSNPDRESKQHGIYSYSNGKLNDALLEESRGKYEFDAYLIDDLDENGLDDVFLLTRNSETTRIASWIKQVSFDGYSVRQISNEPLTSSNSDAIMRFASVTAGKIGVNGPKAIFIDELMVSENLATEIYTMEDGILVPVVSYDMADKQEITTIEEDGTEVSEMMTLYERTIRTNTVGDNNAPPAPVCADVNGDGAIEVPTGRLLPGYDGMDEAERLYLTEYNRVGEAGLTRVMAWVINRTGGYRVEFPPEWIDQVTVVNRSEDNEWVFVEYLGSLDDTSHEIGRIRVVSQKDYQDKFLENYKVFDSRGIFTYYGVVPKDVTSPFAITTEALQQLFALL